MVLLSTRLGSAKRIALNLRQAKTNVRNYAAQGKPPSTNQTPPPAKPVVAKPVVAKPVAKPVNPTQAKTTAAKKGFPFGSVLMGSTVLVVFGYAAALVKAQSDNEFRAQFCEYAPGARELVDKVLDPIPVTEKIQRKATEVAKDTKEGIVEIKSVIQENAESFTEKVTEEFHEASEELQEVMEIATEHINAGIQAGGEKLEEVQQIVSDFIADGKEDLERTVDNVVDFVADGKKDVERTVDQVKQDVERTADLVKQDVESTVDNVKQNIERTVDDVVEALDNIDPETIKQDITSEINQGKEELAEFAESVADSVEDLTPDVVKKIVKDEPKAGEVLAPAEESNGTSSDTEGDKTVREVIEESIEESLKQEFEEVVHGQGPSSVEDAVLDIMEDAAKDFVENEFAAPYEAEIRQEREKISALQGRIDVLEAEAEKLKEKMERERKENEENTDRACAVIEHELDNKYKLEMSKLNDEFHKRKDLEIDHLRTVHNENLVHVQNHLEELYKSYYLQKMEKDEKLIIKDAEIKFYHRQGKERMERLAKLNDLKLRLQKVETRLHGHVQQAVEQQQSTAMNIVVNELSDAIQNGEALSFTKLEMKNTSSSDLVALAVDALPDQLFDSGVCTYSNLMGRFSGVKREAKRGALLPENGGGVGSYMLATMLSYITFEREPVASLASESDVTETDKLLARAEFYLRNGKLLDATIEINQLNGWSRVAAKQWLLDARAHLEAQQTLTLLKAEV